MAEKNAVQIFEQREMKKRSWESLSETLQKRLLLSRAPERIECLDISNFGGQQAVGALVRFFRGEPEKSGFRRYTIRTVSGPDDYAMMEEALTRRLSRALTEGTLPDLFMVDGGRGQLGMAMQVARRLNIAEALDWVGIAKEKDGEGEKLYRPGRKNPILLPPHAPALLYLMRIRDASHRFGLTFHRKLRTRATLRSELDHIPGIGPSRRKQLLREIGSGKRIQRATEEELGGIPGIGPELAHLIFSWFHPDG